MKNKNLTLLVTLLALWPDCTVDHNETAGSTTVTTPDGNCSVTVSTLDYDWVMEEFPNEEMVITENVGTEEIADGQATTTNATAEVIN